MFSRILVGVDESPQAASALELAISLAKAVKASITLVHAIDPGAIAATANDAGAASVMEIELDELQAAGRELLNATAGRVRAAGIEVDTILRDGIPAPTILEVAQRSNSELIVLGTHGRHGVTRLFLGSCAEAVLREANVPVLVQRS